MENMVYTVLNEMPTEPTGKYSSYASKNLVIFRPDTLYCGQASFGCYQFVIPLCDFPDILIEGRHISPQINNLFTVKPLQKHGMIIDKNVASDYYAIFIDKLYLEGLSHDITGKSDFIDKVMQIKIDPKLRSLIDHFIEESNEKQKGYELIIENISNEIAVTLIRLFSCNLSNPHLESPNDGRKNIHEVIAFLNVNYNSNYSTCEIAKIANLSPFHFIRVFKSQTGKTPYEYLLNLRIDKAMKMLRDKNHSITEICFLCGFSNLSHFATAFKKHTGMTPSQYRVNF